MIVVAIIGVLAAIAIPQYSSYIEQTRYVVVQQQMGQLDREIQGFNILHGKYPDSLNELGIGTMDDPWGNPYQYLNIANVKGKGKLRKNRNLVPVNTDYDLYSKGPDGDSKSPFTAKASRDDFVRANNGAFIGRVTDY